MCLLTPCKSKIRRGTLLIFAGVLFGASLLAAEASVKQPLGDGGPNVPVLGQLKNVGTRSVTCRESGGTEQWHAAPELCRWQWSTADKHLLRWGRNVCQLTRAQRERSVFRALHPRFSRVARPAALLLPPCFINPEIIGASP